MSYHSDEYSPGCKCSQPGKGPAHTRASPHNVFCCSAQCAAALTAARTRAFGVYPPGNKIRCMGYQALVSVYMKNFLRYRTLCLSVKGSVSDILLHFPDMLDAISLNFRCFHRT